VFVGYRILNKNPSKRGVFGEKTGLFCHF